MKKLKSLENSKRTIQTFNDNNGRGELKISSSALKQLYPDMIKKILIISIFPILFFAQTGFIKTPEQLYFSITNKKPGGNEIIQGLKDLPEHVDLSSYFPPPGYQGKSGSCAAWAAGYACKTYQEVIERNLDPVIREHHFSPSFLYNLVNNGENKGSTFPDIFNILKRIGCATLKTMPYTEDYQSQPGEDAYKEATKFKIADYKRIESGAGQLQAIRSSLAMGQPVLVAINVYGNFKQLNNQIYSEIKGNKTGGHGMCIIGYNDHNKTLKLINSWGVNWGDQGYCYITYALINDLIMEAYVTYDIIETNLTTVCKPPHYIYASQGSIPASVHIIWDDVEEADSYLLYRSDNKNESLEFLTELSENQFFDNSVLDNVKYLYAVSIKDVSGISDMSEIVCGWASRQELGIPGNVVCELIDNVPNLSWQKVDNANGYYIYRWTENRGNYIRIAVTKNEYFSDISIPADVKDDITFYYLITAYRNEQESKAGNMVQAFFNTKQTNITLSDHDKKKIYHTNEAVFIPVNKQNNYTKGWVKQEFYDDKYIETFFQQARKAEEEAFKKLKQEEDDFFKGMKEVEESYNKNR